MVMTIDISRENDSWDTYPDVDLWINEIIQHGVDIVDIDEAIVSVCLSDNQNVQKLNQQWRNQNKPTNVLSFPSPESMNFDQTILGDIILAFETVEREALSEDKTFKDHFSHLIIHGFLHLLGYDHETDDDAAEMEQLEREILTSAGIKDPYDLYQR
jgi:probable rRNA maturation factor